MQALPRREGGPHPLQVAPLDVLAPLAAVLAPAAIPERAVALAAGAAAGGLAAGLQLSLQATRQRLNLGQRIARSVSGRLLGAHEPRWHRQGRSPGPEGLVFASPLSSPSQRCQPVNSASVYSATLAGSGSVP